MELCPQTSINTGFLNTVPAFVHNHFTFLFALEEGSINEFFSTKKTLEKEEDNALFSKVYIFSRTNYNLQLAKTCPAMTKNCYSNSIVAGGFPVQSYNTLFTPFTSLTILDATFPSTSQGICAGSAVIKSDVLTARNTIA